MVSGLNENDVSLDLFKGLPNFLHFIEADVTKVFGTKGTCLILNMLSLSKVNQGYSEGFGDLCVRAISQSINSIVSLYKDIYAFKFGNNAFIIIFPDYEESQVNPIASKIKLDFNKNLTNKELEFVELDSFLIEYNEEINSIEDFYELLFANASMRNGDKLATKRIIKHIIGTFTTNIRDTLSSFRHANTLALTDDVSGLNNHRAGRLFVSSLIKEYNRNNKGFSVMFVDGDNLKRYNKVSYEAGNQMIRDLSRIITNSIRSEDKVFRWLSGDEFLIVLQGTDKENCWKLAERVRESVEKQTQNFIFPTTISIGIAHYPSDGNSIEEIISKAEKANSYAKDKGRNKVVRWEASMEAAL